MVQGAENAPAAGTWTAPSGMAQRVQQAGGTSVAGAMADQVGGLAGATGTRIATFSQSSQLVGVLVALRPVTSTAYGYDTRGDRTSVMPTGGTATSLAYDEANRLKAYGASVTYAYNGDGLRASKTVSGTTSSFAWDEAEGLPSLLVDGTTNYIYGPGGLPLEQVAGSTVSYYHHDELGSTRALTNSAGSVAATYTYDAYGKLAGSTGSISNPFGYAGQYTDAETGFQYLRARYYDPATAQFLTRDPLAALTGGAYEYASGDPLNDTDPSGMIDAEHGWCNAIEFAKHPSRIARCYIARVAGEDAIRAAQRLGRAHDFPDGVVDALRHCLWSSALTELFGSRDAKGFTDRHERADLQNHMNTHAQSHQDQVNNAVGRAIGREVRDSCSVMERDEENERRCVIAATTGQLQLAPG
jgi:RHS repeat-associated protein